MPLLAGTRLGPYEILAPIGAGGMGEVYRAHDSRLERQVAVKVLPEQLSQSPQASARFVRETKRWRRSHIQTSSQSSILAPKTASVMPSPNCWKANPCAALCFEVHSPGARPWKSERRWRKDLLRPMRKASRTVT